MANLEDSARTVREALTDARAGLVEREALVELVALAAVAGEHVLVIGPPGTAKSEAARRAAQAFAVHAFEYLLGRFTEPSEIFGPVDLRKLREGVVETETSGMLPEAEIAFLDEVFLGSTAILNTLLALLNERTFRRGKTQLKVPLRVCVAASNALPEDEQLAAFADRFLVRAFVEPVPDTMLEALLEQGDLAARAAQKKPRTASLAELDVLSAAARACELAPVRGALAECVRTLRAAGITLTDRRVVKTQRLIAAAAALDGRTVASGADLWPLISVLPTAEAQTVGRAQLGPFLAEARNATLGAAALEASQGLKARAQRIVLGATELLAEAPAEGAERARWKLRLEGYAREIDACFEPGERVGELGAVRAKIAGIVEAA